MSDGRELINFAQRVMTLLEQGKFTSTYKYAVLLSLMDLSMERFSKTGLPPESVTTRQLAEKVIDLYWSHTNQFAITAERSEILLQNRGRKNAQAAIINKIVEFRAKVNFSSLFSAKFTFRNDFNKLLDAVEWTLIEMPLPRLQYMGTTARDFIYTIRWDKSVKKSTVNQYQKGLSKDFDNLIRFKPNVSDFFIQLSGLLRPLIQREWSLRVAETNQLEEARLQEFLFDTNRQPTGKVNAQLAELQEGRCFYCEHKIGKAVADRPEVDHFIPWARYPNDSLANFVVAHKSCNGSKKAFLANEQHLQHWISRLNDDKVAGDLSFIAEDNRWEFGKEKSVNIGQAIYLNLQDEVELWKERSVFTPVSRGLVSSIFLDDGSCSNMII